MQTSTEQTASNAQSKTDEKPVVIRELGEVQKNSEKKLTLRLMEFKGRRYLDMRILSIKGKRWYFEQGITLNKRTFPEVAALLENQREDIELYLNPQEVEP